MKTNYNKIYPVIIIGAGPAGIAAAIQLKRSGIDALLIEKEKCGGLLHNAFLVENYPGFYNGISGKKLISHFTKHLQKLSIDPIYNKVESISYSGSGRSYIVKTDKNIFNGKILIIATGTKYIEPDIYHTFSDRAKENIYFNIYDLNKPENKKILIIGSGDAAFDYALNLSVKNKVLLINRNDKIKALKLLQKRVKEKKSIEYIENTEIESIIPIEKQVVLSGPDNKIIKKKYDLIIFAVGRIPENSFISSQILQKRLELESEKVLFFIGDINNKNFRQASIAVGDGIKAAMEINNKLEG